MGDPWQKLAALANRRPGWVMIAWAMLLLLGVAGALDLPKYLRGDGWVLSSTETGQVDQLLGDAFGWDAARIDLAVLRDTTERLDDPDVRARSMELLSRLKGRGDVAGVVSYASTGDRRYLSADAHTGYALVLYSGDIPAVTRNLPQHRKDLASTGSLQVTLSGNPSFYYDLDQASQQDLSRMERWTLPVIFLLLVLVFGSWLAALLPVAVGGVAVAVTMGLLALWGRVEPLSTFAPNTASMMGLGLGIDFCLLFLSRFREERRHSSIEAALARTLSTAGRSILYSGLTLIAGMGIVYVGSPVPILRSMSFATILVALLSIFAALTLLPALLARWGDRVGRAGPASQTEGWRRWAELVMRRPGRWAIASSLLVLVLALPAVGLKRGFPELNTIDASFPSRHGLEMLRDAFGPGELNPVYLTVHTSHGGVWSRRFREGLVQWTRRLEADPRVVRVDSWPEAVGAGRLMALSPMAMAFDPVSHLKSAPWANVDRGADTVMVRLIPRTGSKAPELRQLVLDLRADRAKREFAGLPVEVRVGGLPANDIDFVEGLYGRFPAMIGAIVCVTFLTLMVFLRSLWLPLKAVVMTCASIAASYGVLVLVFQHGWGAGLIGLEPPGHLTAIIPVLLFGVLFGLSTDYEVFLLTRVREIHAGGATDAEAVAEGLASTGRIITAAAIVMVGVFATFAYSKVSVIKEIGVGLAVGVLLDATVVRMILVPATMRLMGRWNWWLPEWLARWLPEIAHGSPASSPAERQEPQRV